MIDVDALNALVRALQPEHQRSASSPEAYSIWQGAAHEGQKFVTQASRISAHPIAVAADPGGTAAGRQLRSSPRLLHDTIEDTGASYEDVVDQINWCREVAESGRRCHQADQSAAQLDRDQTGRELSQAVHGADVARSARDIGQAWQTVCTTCARSKRCGLKSKRSESA